jgi:hypothetical protein
MEISVRPTLGVRPRYATDHEGKKLAPLDWRVATVERLPCKR